jgi:hypothetical protein
LGLPFDDGCDQTFTNKVPGKSNLQTNLEFETKKGLHFDCIITLKQHQWQLCSKRKSSIPSHREHIEWLGKERCQNDTRVGKQLRVKQF